MCISKEYVEKYGKNPNKNINLSITTQTQWLIRLKRNGFRFLSQQIHRTQTLFQELQQAESLDTVCRPLDQ